MLVFLFSDPGLFILLRGIEISHLQTPILENPTCEKMRCPSYIPSGFSIFIFSFLFPPVSSLASASSRLKIIPF